jgi:hypothetical protein
MIPGGEIADPWADLSHRSGSLVTPDERQCGIAAMTQVLIGLTEPRVCHPQENLACARGRELELSDLPVLLACGEDRCPAFTGADACRRTR